jgi:glycosyltransferase involved in cell wall biosynthesis
MAIYNGDRYLKEQITSILSQLNDNDELIISDDGSQDKSRDVVNSFDDNRIVYTINNGRHGFVGNFENALIRAKGDYIFLSDQDDIWLDNKVSVVLQKLKDYQLIIHNALVVDANGNDKGFSYYDTLHHSSSFLMNLWKTRWLGCCMAFRREVLDYCLPFPPQIVGHDYWIGMVGMAKFSYCFMPNSLIKYRRHSNNTSSASERSNNTLWYKLYTKRVNLLYELSMRILNRSLRK